MPNTDVKPKLGKRKRQDGEGIGTFSVFLTNSPQAFVLKNFHRRAFGFLLSDYRAEYLPNRQKWLLKLTLIPERLLVRNVFYREMTVADKAELLDMWTRRVR